MRREVKWCTSRRVRSSQADRDRQTKTKKQTNADRGKGRDCDRPARSDSGSARPFARAADLQLIFWLFHMIVGRMVPKHVMGSRVGGVVPIGKPLGGIAAGRSRSGP